MLSMLSAFTRWVFAGAQMERWGSALRITREGESPQMTALM
jgi:hypothetical protein